MAADFKLRDNWVGGAYEFLILLKPPLNETLFACLKRLWTHPTLDGCYHWSVREKTQPKYNLSALRIDQYHSYEHQFGIATLPNKQTVVCSTHTFHGDDEDQEPYPYDEEYLYFYIPIGALGKCYSIGADPFEDKTPHLWTREIDE